MPRNGFILLLLALALGVTGCSTPPPARSTIEIDRAEYTRIFQAAEQELRRQGYTLERRDHRFGVLGTVPVNSPTGLEPWRGTNTTLYQATMATTNQLRRIARVTLEPLPEETPAVPSVEVVTAPGTAPADEAKPDAAALVHQGASTYLLTVEVQVEQFQSSLRRLNGSMEGTNMISTLRATPVELSQQGIPGSYWRPVGRDPYLESRMLAAIVRESMAIR